MYAGFGDCEEGKEQMKEIELAEYKAKRVDNGEWLYGHYQEFRELSSRKNVSIISRPDGFSFKIDPETLGQYTGFLDKHDERIYFGDTMTNGKFSVNIIRHENGGIGFNARSGAVSTVDGRSLKRLKITGNMHDRVGECMRDMEIVKRGNK